MYYNLLVGIPDEGTVAVVAVLQTTCAVRLELHSPIHRLVTSILDDDDGAVAIELDVKVVHLAIDAVALLASPLETLNHAIGGVFHHLLVVAVVVLPEVVLTVNTA